MSIVGTNETLPPSPVDPTSPALPGAYLFLIIGLILVIIIGIVIYFGLVRRAKANYNLHFNNEESDNEIQLEKK